MKNLLQYNNKNKIKINKINYNINVSKLILKIFWNTFEQTV